MDPNAALYYFLVGSSKGDREMMDTYYEALTIWLASGNFKPDWDTVIRKAASENCYGGNYTACLQRVRRYFKQCP